MSAVLNQLTAVQCRMQKGIADLTVWGSRHTNGPPSHFPSLLTSCNNLRDHIAKAIGQLRTYPEEAFLIDWRQIRGLAEQGQYHISEMREISRPCFKSLNLVLSDVIGFCGEAFVSRVEEVSLMEEQIRTVLSRVHDALASHTRSFVRTTPFTSIKVDSQMVDFTLKDLLLIGALTHTDLLLVGKTGSGKTKLAMKVMEALFGKDGYYSKTTLPSMSPTDFMDVDFRAIKAGTKTMREAIEAVPALILPGIVLNEANRAPAVVQSMLIPFLDREFEIEGKPVDVGVAHHDERYQYRILTANEGDEYAIEPFDPAIRDRAVLQIPVDIFPQSERDVQQMLQTLATTSPRAAAGVSSPTPECPACKGTSVWRKAYKDGKWVMQCKSKPTSCDHSWDASDNSSFPDVLTLYDFLRRIPVEDQVVGFLVYLSGLSNCIRSLTGYKEGIALDPGTHCHECRHSKHFFNTNLCGNIRAPSARSLINLQRVAQGFALLRAWKVKQTRVSVTVDDIIAAGPFVMRGKLGLRQEWLQTSACGSKEFKGCEWEAIKAILQFLRGSFEQRLPSKDGYGLLAKHVNGETLDVTEIDCLIRFAEEIDNWAVNKVRLAQSKERLPALAAGS